MTVSQPVTEEMIRLVQEVRQNISLYPEDFKAEGTSMMGTAFAKEILAVAAGSNQVTGVGAGRVPHPFDWKKVLGFKAINPHHSACIDAKVSATFGLGFHNPDEDNVLSGQSAGGHQPPPGQGGPAGSGGKKKKRKLDLSATDKELNPLCVTSFQDVLTCAGEDYYSVGSGFIEVVRDQPNNNGKIIGIHHASAPSVYKVREGLYTPDFHFEVVNEAGGNVRKFARFGDLEGFMARAGRGFATGEVGQGGVAIQQDQVSELIHIPRSSALCPDYGFPDWLAAVASMELVACLNQHMYDFFNNRGVPEFILFMLGATVEKDAWAKVESAVKSTIGRGNQHKTMALQVSNPDVKVQVEKLGMAQGGANDFFAPLNETNAQNIVSAHRTPPTLAGIHVPGKMGGNNETTNAVALFQGLVIGPAQKSWEMILANTLGNRALNGGSPLRPADFILKTILEEINLGQMNTQGQMRSSSVEATAQGRDMNAGVKK